MSARGLVAPVAHLAGWAVTPHDATMAALAECQPHTATELTRRMGLARRTIDRLIHNEPVRLSTVEVMLRYWVRWVK